MIRKLTRAAMLGLAMTTALVSVAEAQGVLSIGRREDSTTFDPIATAQNIDFWVFSNVFDVLVRVDKAGQNLLPGLAESWEVSPDALSYTFHLRDAKFSDGTAVTAEDAAYSLTRIRDSELSLWSDSYKIIKDIQTPDAKTLVITLNGPSAPFLSTLAMPGASIISKAAMESMGEEAFAEKPVGSGAFMVDEWRRGDRVILKKNPNYWDATDVSLDGVEWISVPDDNTRMLAVQAGELDAAIYVPFSRVEELKKDAKLNVIVDPSTREDHLLMNQQHAPLDNVKVRQALDYAVDKQAIVDTVTFGIGEVANSYIPKGALYHSDANGARGFDPAKAKELLTEAGVGPITLNYVVNAGNEVDEQIAVLLQQQLGAVGVTLNLQKMDPSQTWDMLVNGEYDLSVMYWTNDILDPDQKTTFVLGHDVNQNYMTRYQNETVKTLVAETRLEMDPTKREALYAEIQKTAKADVHWIDLYYSPYLSVTRKGIENFGQNPLGRFYLEETKKTY
ncbi:peptide/nickel transport system substrate-binding protein [Rhodobacter viridis]|uniref:Peptide/nickel transport system substrate-binding protein n=1 Tax=Rhodobacter viridis TaxID=1054202 RepID=A0A318TZ58_9RHOB|nr:ABC transporter substrate-binding protein [Rhodobacter viridis]PYF10225.1 peptide/nickel transport system substrate-binding protein [Rhodobacter viridis]